MAIQFKQRGDEAKWFTLDFRLRFILQYINGRFYDYLIPVVLITDLDTPGIHMENGPHYRKQGADVSIGSIGEGKAKILADEINAMFDYGRGFKVAMVHGEVMHLHLQVPPPYCQEGHVKLWEVECGSRTGDQ